MSSVTWRQNVTSQNITRGACWATLLATLLVPNGCSTPLEFQFLPTAIVVGSIQTADGSPVVGAAVDVAAFIRSGNQCLEGDLFRITVASDDEGNFETGIGGVAGGSPEKEACLDVRATPPAGTDLRAAMVEQLPILLRLPPDTVRVDLVLKAQSGG